MIPRDPDGKATPSPPEFSFEDWKYKRVVVIASGFVYRGVLLGVDESDVYLKGEFRYLVLPMEKVTSIGLEGAEDGFDPRKSVTPEFYSGSD